MMHVVQAIWTILLAAENKDADGSDTDHDSSDNDAGCAVAWRDNKRRNRKILMERKDQDNR